MAKILTVENDPEIRGIIRHTLSKAGYQTLEAADKTEALWIMAGESPDLMLLDVMMPGTNGFEVCRQIRLDPKNGPL